MKIIDALEVDEFGKRFGPEGGLLSVVVGLPATMGDEHSIRVETGHAGEVIQFDAISLTELSSILREMADWLEYAQRRIETGSRDEAETAATEVVAYG
jgi:hypothetical protein